jgi:hypothetical protein
MVQWRARTPLGLKRAGPTAGGRRSRANQTLCRSRVVAGSARSRSRSSTLARARARRESIDTRRLAGRGFAVEGPDPCGMD